MVEVSTATALPHQTVFRCFGNGRCTKEKINCEPPATLSGETASGCPVIFCHVELCGQTIPAQCLERCHDDSSFVMNGPCKDFHSRFLGWLGMYVRCRSVEHCVQTDVIRTWSEHGKAISGNATWNDFGLSSCARLSFLLSSVLLLFVARSVLSTSS